MVADPGLLQGAALSTCITAAPPAAVVPIRAALGYTYEGDRVRKVTGKDTGLTEGN